MVSIGISLPHLLPAEPSADGREVLKVEPMGVFEYVSVLTSIVIGMGIAHLLKGVARVIQIRGRGTTDWVHLVWVAFMFFQAIFFWWWEFALESVQVWSFGLYLFVVFYAVVIYSMCALLIPADLEGFEGYGDYFMSQRSWFLGLLAGYFVIDFWDTWLKGAEYVASLGLEYPVSSAAYIGCCVLGIRTEDRRFHSVFAVAALVYQVTWALRYYSTHG